MSSENRQKREATPNSAQETRSVDAPGLMSTLSVLERFDGLTTSRELKQRNPYYTRWEGQGLQLPQTQTGVQGWLQDIGVPNERDNLISPLVRAVRISLIRVSVPGIHLAAVLFNGKFESLGTVSIDRTAALQHSGIQHSVHSVIKSRGTYNEAIIVDFNAVSLNVHHILITLMTTMSCSSMTSPTVVEITKGNPKRHMAPVNTVSVTELPPDQSVIIVQLTRKAASWNLKPLQIPMTGTTIAEIAANHNGLAFLTNSPSILPVIRHVTVQVVEGKDLAAKDPAGIFNREATSDPYYSIRFKNRSFISKHVSKTLNPSWNDPPFDLGHLIESEHKALKIVLFDYDAISRDEFMGTIRIPGAALFNAGIGEHRLDFQLGPAKQKEFKNEEVTGQLTLLIRVTQVHATQQTNTLIIACTDKHS